MAKKSRTPPPPRRPVQAPQRRVDHSPADRRRLILLLAFAGAGIVALGIVIAVIALAGGGNGSGGHSGTDSSVAATMRAAGCAVQTKAPTIWKGNQTHVPSLLTNVHWNTYPPGGGSHFPQWAVWGFYDQPVEPIRVVHNEEHGGVVLWWGPQTPASEVEQLRAFYNSDFVSMFGTPVGTIEGKSLGSKVAISAWTGDPKHYQRKGDYGTVHVAVCPHFDEAAFKKFRDAYRGKGPEGIPASSNTPGSGP